MRTLLWKPMWLVSVHFQSHLDKQSKSSHFGPQGEGGGTSVPAVKMMVVPPNPTSIRSKYSNIRQKGRSAAPETASLTSNDSYYSYRESVSVRSLNPSPLIGNNPIGKGPEGESVSKPAKRSFWSTLKRARPKGISTPQPYPLTSEVSYGMPPNQGLMPQSIGHAQPGVRSGQGAEFTYERERVCRERSFVAQPGVRSGQGAEFTYERERVCRERSFVAYLNYNPRRAHSGSSQTFTRRLSRHASDGITDESADDDSASSDSMPRSAGGITSAVVSSSDGDSLAPLPAPPQAFTASNWRSVSILHTICSETLIDSLPLDLW
jgi:hypothetical protein